MNIGIIPIIRKIQTGDIVNHEKLGKSFIILGITLYKSRATIQVTLSMAETNYYFQQIFLTNRMTTEGLITEIFQYYNHHNNERWINFIPPTFRLFVKILEKESIECRNLGIGIEVDNNVLNCSVYAVDILGKKNPLQIGAQFRFYFVNRSL